MLPESLAGGFGSQTNKLSTLNDTLGCHKICSSAQQTNRGGGRPRRREQKACKNSPQRWAHSCCAAKRAACYAKATTSEKLSTFRAGKVFGNGSCTVAQLEGLICLEIIASSFTHHIHECKYRCCKCAALVPRYRGRSGAMISEEILKIS